ncbi:PH domain-containing protein [Streptomyces sp. NPDC048723]|uniref:PH domain-containing protein n=1 Tax=Streptomyces sp. NPDC048723 TaxID=3365589 RepID=UPI00371FB7D1
MLLAVVLGWGLYGRSRRMTTVDREGIVVRGLHPPRRLAWDGIHDIRCVAVPPRRRWGPGTITYAYRTDGRRVPLLCVDDEELPALEPELASLRALLLRQRSAGWAPDPRAEPRIARQNAREEAWDRWFDGWRSYVLIFGVAAAVIAGIVLTGWLGGPA